MEENKGTKKKEHRSYLVIKDLSPNYTKDFLLQSKKHIKFSWKVGYNTTEKESILKPFLQKAYRILVSTSQEALKKEKNINIWDSGKIQTEHSYKVDYRGGDLKPFYIYYWKVLVWDNNSRRYTSPICSFMIAPTAKTWNNNSNWIGKYEKDAFRSVYRELNQEEEIFKGRSKRRKKRHKKKYYNVYGQGYYFLKEFFLPTLEFPIKRAILCITGLGYYTAYCNGKRIGEYELSPAVSIYSKRVYYNSFDITMFLQPGRNKIGGALGGGWFFPGSPDLFGFEKAEWFSPPCMRALLFIETKNGNEIIIGTDETWLFSTEGPLQFNGVRNGEIFDARIAHSTWDFIEKNKEWQKAKRVKGPQGHLYPQNFPSIKITEKADSITEISHSNIQTVFCFPHNVTGWIKIKVKAQKGQTLTIKLNEKLTPDGHVDMETHSGHTYGVFQTHKYICAGKEEGEEWEPMFSYQGFQFAEIEGIERKKILSVFAKYVHSVPSLRSEFSCSHSLIMKIYEISKRTFLNAFHSYPEDCPHREKAGWTEDGAIASLGFIYVYELEGLYEKWIYDMIDAQDESGQIPDIVPTPGWGKPHYDGNPYGKMADPWWGGAIITMPYLLYLHYGRKDLIKNVYPYMKKYMNFLQSHLSPRGLIEWPTLLGDWLEVGSRGASQRTSRVIMASMAYVFYTDIMYKLSLFLGEMTEAKRYKEERDAMKKRINKKFLSSRRGRYQKDSQATLALGLYLEMIPPSLQEKAVKELLTNIIKKHKGHLSTGIVGSYFLYQALVKYGHPEIAFRIITAEGFPGFDYMIKHPVSTHGRIDLTPGTLWEDWDGRSSLCHPVQGTVVHYFYECLTGIRPSLTFPGYKHFLVIPYFSPSLSSLKTVFHSPYGKIRIEWKREEKQLEFFLKIPPNTTATVVLPKDAIESIRRYTREYVKTRELKRFPFLKYDERILFPEQSLQFTLGSGEFFFKFIYQNLE